MTSSSTVTLPRMRAIYHGECTNVHLVSIPDRRLSLYTRYSIHALVCVFFFFQAEDGIRDVAVTGVQTCALPISHGERGVQGDHGDHHLGAVPVEQLAAVRRPHRLAPTLERHLPAAARSGERPHEIGRASCRERV